jgi:uncharacterized membrane protein
VRPLALSIVSLAAAFLASATDGTGLERYVPTMTAESVETLLSIMAASMMVIATLAVASMVSAYATASATATPRSVRLVIADDVSQNALSAFIGAFIYSIVGLTAMKNDHYGTAGLFTLFVLTIVVFGIVILTFVRWVDRIARLGRVGTTVESVEEAAAGALARRRDAPTLCGVSVDPSREAGERVFATAVGYVQQIDIAALQTCAEKGNGRVVVAALPGTFVTPGRPLAYANPGSDSHDSVDHEEIREAFIVGNDRVFDHDPRFGLVVLSEIASRALSPAVNDPGTAIDIIGRLVRLFVLWSDRAQKNDGAPKHQETPRYDRVEVPEVSVWDMLDDAFTAIGRDGAAMVEVAIRLQKGLRSLTLIGDAEMRQAALHHGRLALARAEAALDLPEDLVAVRKLQ